MEGAVGELKVAMAFFKTDAGLGRARLDPASRERLGLSVGDIIEIVGKSSVAAKVFKDCPQDTGTGIICIDGTTRSNAGVSVGDTVRIVKHDVVYADSVTFAPNIPSGKTVRFDSNINDRVREGLFGRPVMTGNDVFVPNVYLMGNLAPFTVVETEPRGLVVLGTNTEVKVLDRKPRSKRKTIDSSITYDDVGGLDDELRRIRDMIEVPLKHPELFVRLGISAPKGVLLYGPPGTGKTLIAKAVAKESGAAFYSIQGPEIVSKYYGESEGALREIFEQASKNAPSIVFIDEIDSIAPNRDQVSGEVERRIVAQLLTLMDGMSGRGDVIVIGATNREEAVDPALRRPGRFDREIEIGVPGLKGRAEILGVHLRGMPLAEDVDIDAIAGMTQGFVGADLAALAREAAMKCLNKHMHLVDRDGPAPETVLEDVKVTMADFREAFSEVEPSGMREVLVDIPNVRWSDIGGLEDVKRELKEAFMPGEGGKEFEKLGISMPKGVLLYGPPGTGKTMLAKAMANESGANFICINGPEIASKWLGESEKAIRQIFKKARQMSPCILFFDEIDAVAPKRGQDGSGAWERVVNQLLTSMDGMEKLDNVIVMGATNRPDMIDPALLRPGRFDKKILIGLPDYDARRRVLEVHTSKMPMLGVSLDDLAQRTDGYVGADLAELCREAGMCAYREDKRASFISMRHFEEALKTVKPSVSDEDMKAYREAEKEMTRRGTNFDSPLYG